MRSMMSLIFAEPLSSGIGSLGAITPADYIATPEEPQDAAEDKVLPGQRQPPRKEPTKRLVSKEDRRAKRKAARAARRRNR